MKGRKWKARQQYLIAMSVFFDSQESLKAIPVAARSKAWVCGHSLAVTVGLNLTGGMDVCLL
jgi:hypothetical protein